MFRKAALKGNAVAQNRLARILATGRGLPADPIAATKWHTIAKADGASDVWLEDFMQRIKDTERAAGENRARRLARARQAAIPIPEFVFVAWPRGVLCFALSALDPGSRSASAPSI